jgi:hypothetical protein
MAKKSTASKFKLVHHPRVFHFSAEKEKKTACHPSVKKERICQIFINTITAPRNCRFASART